MSFSRNGSTPVECMSLADPTFASEMKSTALPACIFTANAKVVSFGWFSSDNWCPYFNLNAFKRAALKFPPCGVSTVMLPTCTASGCPVVIDVTRVTFTL